VVGVGLGALAIGHGLHATRPQLGPGPTRLSLIEALWIAASKESAGKFAGVTGSSDPLCFGLGGNGFLTFQKGNQ